MGYGFVKIDRSLLEWEWYDDANMVRLWLHLNLKASYKESSWQGMQVTRGQIITGRKKLADETGMSERQVRTCLNRMLESGKITIESTNRFSIITICKSDSYENNSEPNDQQATSKRPARRPTNDHLGDQQKDSINNSNTNSYLTHSSVNDQQNDQQSVPKTTTIKELRNKEEYIVLLKQAVNLLNDLTNSSYRVSTKSTRKRVHARYQEGYRWPDFEKVIRSKAKDWEHDPKMKQYLRPETLFGTKFESYLQSASIEKIVPDEIQLKGRTIPGKPKNNYESCWNFLIRAVPNPDHWKERKETEGLTTIYPEIYQAVCKIVNKV